MQNLQRHATTFQFLNQDRTAYRRDTRAVGSEELLDAIGPVLFVVSGEDLQPVPKWNSTTMRLLAADSAAHVLQLFEGQYPDDDRPRRAIEAARRGPSRPASLEAARSAVAASADAVASTDATPEQWRSETYSVREKYARFAAASWEARAAARAARTRDAASCRAALHAAREAAANAGMIGAPGERGPEGILFKSSGRVAEAAAAVARERAWQADRLWEVIGG